MLPIFSGNVTQNIPNPTPSFSNVLLISKLVKVLHKLERKQQLDSREMGILSRGKILVSKIIEGAKVIENKEFDNAFPIEEGINTYGYALRTMKTLNLYREAQESTLFFEELLNRLEGAAAANHSDVDIEIDPLKKFFLALGDSFSGEIYRREYQSPKTFETPLLM